MTIKTATTQNGKMIKVEIIREVNDKVSYADGFQVVTGREIIEITSIIISDASGKTLVSGSRLDKLNQKTDSKAIAAGAVAKLGNAYIMPALYEMIVNLLAEVEAETPKSDEQKSIELAIATAEAKINEYENSQEYVASKKMEAEMDRSDSDL
jgi:hypothetical protein